MNDILLNVENLSQWFPLRRGLFLNTRGYIKAVDDVSFRSGAAKLSGW